MAQRGSQYVPDGFLWQEGQKTVLQPAKEGSDKDNKRYRQIRPVSHRGKEQYWHIKVRNGII